MGECGAFSDQQENQLAYSSFVGRINWKCVLWKYNTSGTTPALSKWKWDCENHFARHYSVDNRVVTVFVSVWFG